MARQRVRPSGVGRARPGTVGALLALGVIASPAAQAAPEPLGPWQPASERSPGEVTGVGGGPAAAGAQASAQAGVQAGADAGAQAGAGTQAGAGAPGAQAGARGGGSGASGSAPLPGSDAQLPPLPSDPNDAPFMAPPNNQLRGKPPRTRPDVRRGWSARRRFAFTVAPAFASFRLAFQGRVQPDGRTSKRLHGAGINLELDAQLYRWIWLRVQGTYSGHPVDDERVMTSEGDVVQTAPRGTIHATGFGAGPVFALDLGRFLPLIEVGLGGLRVSSPASEVRGQRGATCGEGGVCDAGLKCSASNVCEPTLLPELYFGAAVDVLIARNFSVGGQFRYYAVLPAWSRFPVYLLGTVRVGVRF